MAAQLIPQQLAEVLEHLSPPKLAALTQRFSPERLAAVLNRTSVNRAVELLHMIPADRTEAVLDAITDSSALEPLLEHEDESADGIMTPDTVSLRPDTTAKNAIAYLRIIQPHASTTYYLYIVDPDERLRGVVNFRDLVIAPPDRTMSDLMNPEVIVTTTDTDQEEVLRLLQHYNLRAIPVVDTEAVSWG